MGIAEEGLDAECFVKPVMFGEFGAVVEADGSAHRLRQLAQLAGDRVGGEDRFSIDWMVDDAEAGLPFVEDEQPLAISGEKHEIGFPVTWNAAIVDLDGAFGDGAPLFDETGGTARSPC